MPRLDEPKQRITVGKFQNVDLRVARVISAPMAEGTNAPSRVLTLDVGPLGRRLSVAQFALIDESGLVGKNVIACVNFAPREVASYLSEVLVLGAPHPDSPDDQAQATPLYVADIASPGDMIF